MTIDFLRHFGERLYGPLWQSALARDLGISDRTVRHWVAGDNPMPNGLATKLHSLITDRIVKLEAVRLDLWELSKGAKSR